MCVCVNFVSFADISTSVKNMSLKRKVLSQRNPNPPSCSHYNLRRHMEYILTLTLSLSLSLTKYTHFLGFTISCVVMVIQIETVGECVCVCVCVCEREREWG